MSIKKFCELNKDIIGVFHLVVVVLCSAKSPSEDPWMLQHKNVAPRPRLQGIRGGIYDHRGKLLLATTVGALGIGRWWGRRIENELIRENLRGSFGKQNGKIYAILYLGEHDIRNWWATVELHTCGSK